ncbi:IPT/TIG domain-containing protein [Kitasatospora sp. NPDC036755]|uniref:IPT/TIG domain-containing protein n=1 Tax=Kitasatospora sp. NPDC036755 TaxID=3154600 RepID=UPI00340A5A94
MPTIIRLAGAGLAAALSLTAAATPAGAADLPAEAPAATVIEQRVVLTQAGNYPTEQNRHGVFSVSWRVFGTEDLGGPTHFTVDLPPGVTTGGAMFYSTPYDYTFTETVSPDGRHLEAVLYGNRRSGTEEFMKIPVVAEGTGPVTGAITARVANANDTIPTGHVSTYLLGIGLLPPTIGSQPRIDDVSATTGPGAGGTPVTVTGVGLEGAMVLVGGVPAPGTCTGTVCTVTTPGGSGSAAVTVAGPGGTAQAPAAFDYTGAPPPPPPAPVLSGLNTPSGPAGGGTAVIVTGANLAGATVSFGGRPATRHSCGPQLCTATAPPADRPGPVDVTVTTAGGTGGPLTFSYTA